MHLFQDSTIRKRRNKSLGSLAAAKPTAHIIRERLLDVRWNFGIGLAIGAFRETQEFMVKADRWLMVDSSAERLKRFAGDAMAVCAKEEILPLEVESMDLCVSFLTMHRTNNLHIHLEQMYHVLRPGGMFLGTLPGGKTLVELQESLMEGEAACSSTAAMRVGPFMDLANGVGLLQNAGFHMCMGDRETFTFYYPSMTDICAHIRGAGENYLLAEATPSLSAPALTHAENHYRELYSRKEGLQATFEVLFLSGWKK